MSTAAAAPPVRLLYFGGFGDGGAEALTAALAARPGIVDLGDVARAGGRMGRGRALCACGRRVSDCPAWAGVFAWAPDGIAPADAVTHARMLAAVAETMEPAVILDTSSTGPGGTLAARPEALRSALRRPMMLVHLMRDPRAAIADVLARGRDGLPVRGLRRVAGAFRLALAWREANRAAAGYGRRHPDEYCRLEEGDAAAPVLPPELRAFLAGPDTAARADTRHGLRLPAPVVADFAAPEAAEPAPAAIPTLRGLAGLVVSLVTLLPAGRDGGSRTQKAALAGGEETSR